MGKIHLLWVLAILFLSCQRQQTAQSSQTGAAEKFNLDSVPKSAPVNDKTSAILDEWQEYNTLAASVETIYLAENEEDLILIIEAIIENQKQLEESEYPETFDTSPIKSRQRVLKTYILKVKAALENRTELTVPVTEMIGAYNAMRMQFNVIVNNNLDSLLILNQ